MTISQNHLEDALNEMMTVRALFSIADCFLCVVNILFLFFFTVLVQVLGANFIALIWNTILSYKAHKEVLAK